MCAAILWGDVGTWVGVAISILAIGISIVAIVSSDRTQRRVLEIAEQLDMDRRTTSRRANLRAEAAEISPRKFQLDLINDGQADARNIGLKLDGMNFHQNPRVIPIDEIPDSIYPKGKSSLRFNPRKDCDPKFDIEITWLDDTDVPGSHRAVIIATPWKAW